ncbi:thioredoxin-disulfide reductase [Desulforamulus hydrothermalis]|uniref:Thioredoxin reductase n=1 Tax=Desulforamulus hydrothermalis Lam5 = DSM 18033 TaxID=1121428 RepID=K8DYX6_9FIRM|nr:thioredoxin-disulfide reductase [Desulforamulus hydrothermalis]CCO08129.1 Thioredoxin-disulfide reductase [Desulforamulus hydrothermalis Lam5 = DSM 18033]SHG81356.1 thioredoxin reductase (NADPH) [Desulforamulus hydrothermalis Lam5 = DSM 18033]
MSIYDLIIIGGGPAGLAAGIYGARARLKTAVLEKGAVGGMAFTTREIVNFPGFKSTSGPELMKTIAAHAKEFGAEIIKEEVTEVDLSGEIKIINTKKGRRYQARAVILAPGSQPRLLNIPGERALRGNGVSYCATCDAEFYTDLDVVVVGNGDAAIEEAMYITKYARKVTVIVIHDEGIVDCNRASAEKAFQNPKIEFVWNSVLAEIKGKGEVEAVVVKNLKTGELTELKAHGVFIYVGMVPGTSFLQGQVELDERGYIIANEQMETSVDGVFAAGDARVKYLRQVVTAANDGAIAAVAAERYLEEEQSFKEEVLNADKPVLLVFWSPANSESINLAGSLEALVAAQGGQYKIVKVDVSRKKRIARKYGITDIPSVVLVENGRLKAQLSGNLNHELIKERFKL